MMQKPWFKLFIWFMSTFFFFLASMVVISLFKPGPSETEVMSFMEGMMSAMDKSLMGVAMAIESNTIISSIISISAYLIAPILIISLFLGILIRFNKMEK